MSGRGKLGHGRGATGGRGAGEVRRHTQVGGSGREMVGGWVQVRLGFGRWVGDGWVQVRRHTWEMGWRWLGASATGAWGDGRWRPPTPINQNLKKNIVQFVIDFVQLPYML